MNDEAKSCKKLENEADNCMCEYAYKHKNVNNCDKDKEETYRTTLRRQRDKILYTGGFRRLQDKTQVMPVLKMGDHRTRLTHTLEVEQIAISVADALSLNKDLVSAIALGHDVGHTPFGHSGERTLNDLLEGNGGFYHSIQSVKYIWGNYGSKIDNKVYEGILKHDSDMFSINKQIADNQDLITFNIELDENFKKEFIDFLKDELGTPPSTLEAQIVIWADKIAYITHDFEDFYKSELYNEIIKKDKTCQEQLENILKKITGKNIIELQTRDLIRSLTNNLIESSFKNLQKHKINMDTKDETGKKIDQCINDITKDEKEHFKNNKEILEKLEKLEKNLQNAEDSEKENIKKDIKKLNKIQRQAYLKGQIINIDTEIFNEYLELREIVDKYYIGNIKIKKSDIKGEKIIKYLFEDLMKHPEILPKEYNCNKHTEEKDRQKKIAYYISTMTDDYARKMYLHLNSLIDDFEI
ncbi:HD domain-containing protein [Campylobacter pinnipediorum]|uniref:HD domain-containing protein n=1 Tax=Campylobacter pinnipediorum TaxID=1965231 RepID=UPI00084D3A86|nr:HD domain-containing protein [Campylobacter pinnipediorum]